MAKDPVRVLVTGAAGQIGYALVPMIARGVMLGADQPVILHMLDIPAQAKALNDVKTELVDAGFPLLKGVLATTDVVDACTGVNIAVMLGGFPTDKEQDMAKSTELSTAAPIYKEQGYVLQKHAAFNIKVLVVASPANTLAEILKTYAEFIPKKNITSLARLDHNRALGLISERLSVPVCDVKNVIIWGDPSCYQYRYYIEDYAPFCDVNHATVTTPSGEKSVRELVKDDAWLNTKLRDSLIIKSRKLKNALCAANSVCDHIRDWVLGTPEGTWVSMGVCSDGSYNIPDGLVYSFPVTCQNGEWKIVQGLPIDESSGYKLDQAAKWLMETKDSVFQTLFA